MKKDIRLYIDNELTDVTDATDVTLEIKSNLFADVSKMISNSTLTIKLPKTTHNQRLIANADRIHGGGTYPYEWHRIDFYRNGVQLIRNGKAVVMSIGDDIELSAIWGLMPAFATLQQSQLQLNQLQTDARLKVTYAQTADTYADALAADYFFADFSEQYIEGKPDKSWHQSVTQTSGNGQVPSDGGGHRRPSGSVPTSGFDNLGNKIYLHPSVKVSWLLELIAAQTGVTFSWSGGAKTYIDTLIIPLVKKKANELSFDGGFAGTLPVTTSIQQLPITINAPSNLFTEQSGAVQQLTAIADTELYVNVKAAYHADGITFSGGATMQSFYPLYCELSVNEFGSDPVIYTIGRNQRAPNNKVSIYSVTNGRFRENIGGYGRVSINAGQNIQIATKLTDDLGYSYTFEGGSVQIDLAGTTDEVTAGMYFPIAENLPEIKVIDLVKTLCVLTGTFPLQTSGDEVRFVPYATILANVPNAVDWSSRLMPNEAANKPRDVVYKADDWAQVNWYKWKEDSTITTNYNASLDIENNTLDASRDIYTLPFAATENNVIPLYTLSDDGTKVTYKACQPRIMRLAEGENSQAVGVFDIDLSGILADLHAPLLQMLQDARVVTEHFALSDVDILNFDESKPVYIRQYGAYFAVTKITAKENGIAEVKMMKINM